MSEHPWLVQLNEQGYRLTDSRRASAFRELNIPPENVFREVRETMSKAIVAAT